MSGSAREESSGRIADDRASLRGAWRRLSPFLAPDRGRLCFVVFLVVVTSMLGLAGPLFLEHVIDHALRPPYDTGVLRTTALVFAVLAILRFATGWTQQYQFARLTARLAFRMRQRFFDHLLRLPLGFFVRTPTGEILTRLTRDLSDAQGMATGAVLSLVASILNIIGSVLLLSWFNLRLFAMALVAVPVALLVGKLLRRRMIAATAASRECAERVASYAVESLHGMKSIRAAAATRIAGRRFAEHQAELARRGMHIVRLDALGGRLPDLLLALLSLAIFVYGGLLVARGEEELGDLVAFVLVQGRLIGPVQGLLTLWFQVQRSLVGAGRVFEYLDREAPPVDEPGAASIGAIVGAVRFESVGFGHENAPPLLAAVDLEIAAGEHIGITGRNGSGKSTLVELLFGLHRPQTGRILVDGIDIRTITRKSLNRQMALVPQDAFLFRDTVSANVRFAAPDADRAAVREALRCAGAEDFVLRMPQGEETIIGERGTRLSAGERQRLALARAFLADPRILVLDEATAHLDREGGEDVQRALDDLTKGRTAIIVSPRLADLVHLDRIVVLDGGRVVADGSPGDVARRCPWLGGAR